MLIWCLALFAAIFTSLFVFVLAPRIAATPDLSLINTIFVPPMRMACLPEPREQLQYIMAIVGFPIIFMLLFWIFRKSKGSFVLALVAQFVLLGFCTWTYVYQHRFVYGFFIPIQLARTALYFGIAWMIAQKLKNHRVPTWIPITIAGIYPALFLMSTLFTESAISGSMEVIRYHFPFTYTEFAAVWNGRTPWCDYFPQYAGLIPMLTLPLFKIFGTGMFAYSLGLALLSWLGLFVHYSVFRQVTEKRWWALALFLPFATIGFFPIYWSGWDQFNMFNYYAVGPLRYFGPWMVTYFLSKQLAKPSPGRLIAVSVCASGAVLSSLDFGFPAFVGSLAAVVLHDPRSPKQFFSRGLIFLATFVGVVLSYSCLLYFRSGIWPDLSQIYVFQLIFAKYGFFMLPMPPTGLHWIFYAIFMSALVSAWSLRASTKDRLLRGLLLYSGLFGGGAMFYFVGRSAWQVLVAIFPAVGFALMLLVWNFFRKPWRPGALSWIPAGLLIFGYLACGAFVATPNPYDHLSRILSSTDPKITDDIARTIGELRPHLKKGDPVLLLHRFGYHIANLMEVKDVFPLNHYETLMTYAHLDQVTRAIDRSHVKVAWGRISDDLAGKLLERGFRKANAELWLRDE